MPKFFAWEKRLKNRRMNQTRRALFEQLEVRLVLATSAIPIESLDKAEAKAVIGDRAGAYLDYANLLRQSGATEDAIQQVAKQAQITTGSGMIGGAAGLGNMLAMQQAGAKYNVSLSEFSSQILLRGLDAAIQERTRSSANYRNLSDRDGVLTKAELLLLDYSVWNDKGIGRLFPGNFDMYFSYNEISEIPQNSIVWSYLNRSDIPSKSDTLKSTIAVAGSIMSWADSMGFKPSDYGFSNESLRIEGREYTSTDGKYAMTWNESLGDFIIREKSTGFTTSVYDPTPDSWLLRNSDWTVELFATLRMQGFDADKISQEVYDEIAAMFNERTFVVSSPDGTPRELKLNVHNPISKQERDEFLRTLGFQKKVLRQF